MGEVRIASTAFRPANEPDPPHVPANIEAEQALLGTLMFDNSAMGLLGEFLKAEHFYEPFHQRLFEVIEGRIRKNQMAEPVLIGEQFMRDQAFEELGGMAYLADLLERAPPTANAPEYARAIFDQAVKRQVVTACTLAARQSFERPDLAAFDLVSGLRSSLEQIEHDAAPEDASMIDAPAAAADAIAKMEERARSGRLRGKMTGLRCIDRRLGGLQPGALVVIGGRPGMCKTGLARAILHGAATLNRDDEFLFCGIEMGPEEMMQRELSSLTHLHADGVEYQAMAKGAVTPFDFQSIAIARQHVPPNLILDDCPALSLEDVRRKVWSMGRKAARRGRKLAAVAIDYLQLMKRPAANGRNEATVLGEITQGLKQIARQAGICILLLSQLSRAVESRDDKRPQLSDLRESGSIEQDADAVLFPFREFYYVEKQEPRSGADKHLEWEMQCAELRRRLDVICAKQRMGPVGFDRQTYWAEFDFIEDCHD